MTDSYLVPNLSDNVLRNRIGATNPERLSTFERRASTSGEMFLKIDPVKQTFNRKHLSAIHERLFGEVYEWAGRMRDESFTLPNGAQIHPINISKGSSSFDHFSRIDASLKNVASDIRKASRYRGLDEARFVTRAAEIYSVVNTAHPFREGNGRTQRIFLEDLGRAAGHEITWSVIDGERNIKASIAAGEDNNIVPMQQMFRDAIQPERVAMLTEACAWLTSSSAQAWKRDAEVETRTLLPFTETNGILIARTENTALIVTGGNELIIARANDVPANAEQYAQVSVTGSFEPSDYSYHPQDARKVRKTLRSGLIKGASKGETQSRERNDDGYERE